MASSRGGFIVRVLRIGPTGVPAVAGVGFAVDEKHIVTCAHVVNMALGRHQRVQNEPGPTVRVQVEFPLADESAGAPTRSCEVRAWVPPPSAGISGGDVAGLVMVGEGLPSRAAAARLADFGDFRDTRADVFGYPADPPRLGNGAWVRVALRSAVGGGMIQLDTDSVIRAQPGYSGSPVIVADEAGHDAVLGMLAAASTGGADGDAYAIPVAELARAWPDVVGRLTIPNCPYRGLGSFTAADSDVFVGRERDVQRLADLVRGRALVLVTGPSGVGKSSLVNAGLIPSLKAKGWAVGSFRPAEVPLDALATALALLESRGATPEVAKIEEWMTRIAGEGLSTAGARLAIALQKPVLLHADQLEEVLDPTVCRPEQAQEFLDLLLSAHAAADKGLHVVSTIRVDFWGQLLEYPDAGSRLQGGMFQLSPMKQEQLERVIAEPASNRGVSYEDSLARVIAKDAEGAGGLPLLEFALTQLWSHQRARTISLGAYQRTGGVAGALQEHANQAYEELTGRFQEERIRRVMLALVRSRGHGDAVGATRRVVRRDHLGDDWEVAQALASHRLVVVGRDRKNGLETVEIAHEAVIREWPMLASWVEDDAEFQRWLAWAEERASDGDPLPDGRLGEADRWLHERGADIPVEVQCLIEISKSEWTRRVTELEEARNRAEQARRYAEARRLAAASELALTARGASPQVPVILAIESLKAAQTIEGDVAIRRIFQTAERRLIHVDDGDHMEGMALSPDGMRVVAASYGGSAHVFDRATGAEICRLDHINDLRDVAFSADGTRVVTGGGSGRVFDAITGTEICRLESDYWLHAVALSPDGTRVITSTGRTARLFDGDTGTEICRLDLDNSVHAVAFSPNGARLAAATITSGGVRAGGSARVFDAALKTQICRLHHDSPVHAVAFSPDSDRVVTGTAAIAVEGSIGGARVFDVSAGAEICRMDHDSSVCAVAFSPDGKRIVTASDDRGARVFDVSAGTEICRMDHDISVRAVAFSPDGKRVITASKEGCIRVWRIDHDQLIEQAMGRLARNLTRREWRRYFYDEPYRKTREDLP